MAISYFPSNEGRTSEGQAFLFTRDLPLAVMPIGGSRNRPEYNAKLDPENVHLTLWLANLLDADARRGELDDALVDFIETVTQYLAHFGEVFYEIVSTTRAGGGSKSTGKSSEGTSGDDPEPVQGQELPPIAGLLALPPGKVWRVPRHYIQVIPKGDRERIGQHFVSIPSARIWHLRLPARFGSPRAHRRLLRRLERLDPLRPDFAMEVGDMGRSVGFDFRVQRTAFDIEQERATMDWGRIPSVGQIEGTTEYLFLARILQWRLSQAIIREHVIAELNRLLDRLDIGHRIVVTGIPSAKEVDEALRQMTAGDITVAEAMEVTRV